MVIVWFFRIEILRLQSTRAEVQKSWTDYMFHISCNWSSILGRKLAPIKRTAASGELNYARKIYWTSSARYVSEGNAAATIAILFAFFKHFFKIRSSMECWKQA